MGKVHVVSEYACTPDQLWAVTKDLDALRKMNARMVRMEGLPSGDMYAGQDIQITTSLFGRTKPQVYRIVVTELSDETREFRSTEHGNGVKSWKHHGRVERAPKGSRLVDDIEIDAGWMTPLVVAWANILYKARHKPRLQILRDRGALTE
ncbi:SRPBCC family protein [Pseudooceanicola atlanticus]|uniref:Polyketide cyclase n=1 Tax=Pseudooceanicola atlanticus TaxID=1461694 RepID=A0A0A0EJS9_9RHOB|nr:SRPBCC family protein [Pseudooceanicola atlanticus]KGM49407.1 hypothetical protein ATO9_05120 [Pseudooceanicola atlanticus]